MRFQLIVFACLLQVDQMFEFPDLFSKYESKREEHIEEIS